MNWISNWLYDNAIKCHVRGFFFRLRYGKDETPGGCYDRLGRFHENVSQQTGYFAEGGDMTCEDCGETVYL